MIQLEQISDISCYEVRFPWVRQNEPEAHLDGLVQKIISLPDINNRSPIWGLSYKDESTVERFRKLGLLIAKQWIMHLCLIQKTKSITLQ